MWFTESNCETFVPWTFYGFVYNCPQKKKGIVSSMHALWVSRNTYVPVPHNCQTVLLIFWKAINTYLSAASRFVEGFRMELSQVAISIAVRPRLHAGSGHVRFTQLTHSLTVPAVSRCAGPGAGWTVTGAARREEGPDGSR